MIPKISSTNRSLIYVDPGTTLEQAVNIMKEKRIEKLPIIADGELVGVYSLKDSERIGEYPEAAKDSRGRLLVGAAIGVHEMDVERAHRLAEAGVDVIFIDIAHGHHLYTKKMIDRLKNKENITIPIIAGNVATRDGALYLYEAGADGIKVGIGPGGVCTTRNIAGTGVPQITAIIETSEALVNKSGDVPPIIADGGIREPGDFGKAIVAGAQAVMIGSLFAGTDESPGDPINVDGMLKKLVRGMASRGAASDRAKMGDSTTNQDKYVPEGRETPVDYQGSVVPMIETYVGGLRSAMSYAGAHTIAEMNRAKLDYVSQSGANENTRKMK